MGECQGAIQRGSIRPRKGGEGLGAGLSVQRYIDNRLGELVGVPRTLGVACLAGVLSVDVQ